MTVMIVLCTAFAGCTEDSLSSGSVPGPAASKIINSRANAVPGGLIIKLDSRSSGQVASMTRGGAVPADSGFMTRKEIKAAGATGMHRLFPSYDERTEMLVRKYGLDRWYYLSLPEDSDLESAAAEVADMEDVEAIQYNTALVKASDGMSVQYVPSAAGRAVTRFNDDMLSSQWHYDNAGDISLGSTARAGADINVTDAWRITGGNRDIIVAVIDEAVQYDHPDLQANMWINPDETQDGEDNDGNGIADDIYGANFSTPSSPSGRLEWNNPGDVGHGTHVAGTVAAVNNNREGVCGIAGGTGNNDGVRIMSLQILSGLQQASDAATAQAIYYALTKGAHIIQCSWGYEAGSTITSDAVFERTATAAAINAFVSEPNDILDGGLAIFAAGNEATAVSGYPAGYRECISVTSFAIDNKPAYYTNYGPGCNIAAPGGEDNCNGQSSSTSQILSTMPTESIPLVDDYGQETGQMRAAEYGYMQGTSMACPHVSGVAALGLSYARTLGRQFTRDEFTAMLYSSTGDIDQFLTGSKYTYLMNRGAFGNLSLDPYRGNMGTGSIDAWKLLMNVEGTPFVTVQACVEQYVPLEEFFGDGASGLDFTSVEISDADKAALGLASDPEIVDGKLRIFPLLTGSARLTVKALAGTGNGSGISGSEFSREISILSRNTVSQNGGWL